MLYLDSGIHLHKKEVAVLVYQEFDRSGAFVADVFSRFYRRVAHCLAKLGSHKGRRSFFEQFLVAALNGAVALAQVGGLPRLVANYLNLNVARLFDELLHVHPVVSECRCSLLAGGFPCFFEVCLRPNGAHSLAPASGSGLHHHGVANFFSRLFGVFQRVEQAFRARYAGHSSLVHGGLGCGLVAHFINLLGPCSDELNAVLGTNSRKP